MFSNSLPGVLRWDGDSFLKPLDGAWFDLKVLAMELRTCGWENPTKKVVFNRTYMGEKMEKHLEIGKITGKKSPGNIDVSIKSCFVS